MPIAATSPAWSWRKADDEQDDNRALVARFDILSLALQEVARALSPAQAAQVTGAVGQPGALWSVGGAVLQYSGSFATGGCSSSCHARKMPDPGGNASLIEGHRRAWARRYSIPCCMGESYSTIVTVL